MYAEKLYVAMERNEVSHLKSLWPNFKAQHGAKETIHIKHLYVVIPYTESS